MMYTLEKIGKFRKYKPIYNTNEPIKIGTSVKLIFKLPSDKEVNAERLWIDVTDIGRGTITGKIDNDPVCVDMKYGDIVTFTKQNIFDIDNS